MTLTNYEQRQLESKGFEWKVININGRNYEGFVNFDVGEFYEHGSGNSFEPSIRIKWDSNEDYYTKQQ